MPNLNVPASIKETGRRGGIPALEFYKKKQVRSLLILEDAFAEPTAWNPIARELAEGMRNRGVPVLYGTFNGTPDYFKTANGSVFRLEDLEDDRRGYLLLIFSDGKGVDRQTGNFALEALSHWPMVAWMELREPRFWDETSTIPVRHNIPIYPTNPAGLLKAVTRFLTEKGTRDDFTEDAENWEAIPDLANTDLTTYIEQLLGDALSWAQECTMMPFGTISVGLADELRQQFHPDLPPERIERLFMLPGTCNNISGLHFSDEVLKVLRHGFFQRRSQREQEEVLKFLKKRIQDAEPKKGKREKDSLAHLAWEAVLERLNMELDPDDDLKRFARLAKSPLDGFIEASLENFDFSDQKDKIPLRFKPKNKNALQRLAHMNKNLGIPILQGYSIALEQGYMFVVLIICSLLMTLFNILFYLESLPSTNWNVEGLEAVLAQLEVRDGKLWQVQKAGTIGSISNEVLSYERVYRLTLFGNGICTSDTFKMDRDSIPNIFVEYQDLVQPCSEEFPDMGLKIIRCPTDIRDESTIDTVIMNSWRERLGELATEDRTMSVGLVLLQSSPNSNDFLSQGFELLFKNYYSSVLKTGAVDVIFLIQPDRSGNWKIQDALAKVKIELGVLSPQSQLIVWASDQSLVDSVKDDFALNFGRTLKSWGMVSTEEIRRLLESADKSIIEEQAILSKFDNVRVMGNGSPIVFPLPPTRTGTLIVNTTPRSARLSLTNLDTKKQQIGYAGQQIELEPGNWKIIVYADGFEQAERLVEIKEGETHQITIDLSPLKGNYIVIAFSSDNRQGVVNELNRLRQEFGNALDQEFPNIAIYDDPLTHFALVVDANLSYQQANSLVAKAVKFGFQRDTYSLLLESIRPGTGSLVVNTQPARARITVTSRDNAITRRGTSGDRFTLTTEYWNIKAEVTNFNAADTVVNILESRDQRITLILAGKDVELPQSPPQGMVLIPGGWFNMGSNEGRADEKPIHKVYIDSFYLDKTQVTVSQFKEFCIATGRTMPEQPEWNDNNHPVVNVCWEDANVYAEWAEKRLPTEAEWEYAARGGLEGKNYPWGNDISHSNANYYGSGEKDKWYNTAPVGSFPPNGYGLYDMAGNVYEWCADWYDENYYRDSPNQNPQGPKEGNSRVLRNGSWHLVSFGLRTAKRGKGPPTYRLDGIGFRCAMDAL